MISAKAKTSENAHYMVNRIRWTRVCGGINKKLMVYWAVGCREFKHSAVVQMPGINGAKVIGLKSKTRYSEDSLNAIR